MASRMGPAGRRLLVATTLLPLALDIKKFGDSTVATIVQGGLVISTLAAAAVYFAARWLRGKSRTTYPELRRIARLWWLYISLSPLPVLVWSIPFDHYLKVALPYILYGIGLSLVLSVCRRPSRLELLFDLLFWGALFSTVWRAGYVLLVMGISVDVVRWEILGPAVAYLLGYGAAGIYLRRRPVRSAVALALALVLSAVSVTRSYVLSIALVGLAILLDLRHRSPVRAFNVSLVTSFAAASCVAIAIGAAILLSPDLLWRWKARLTEHALATGSDITLVTRIAEYRGQIQALTESPATLLLGRGIGATYTWDQELAASLPVTEEERSQWFAGHSTWIYPLFASGLPLGLIVPYALVFVWRIGLGALGRRTPLGVPGAVLPFAILMAYLGQSFTANVFHERYAGLVLGVTCGATLAYARLRERRGAHMC